MEPLLLVLLKLLVFQLVLFQLNLLMIRIELKSEYYPRKNDEGVILNFGNLYRDKKKSLTHTRNCIFFLQYLHFAQY